MKNKLKTWLLLAVGLFTVQISAQNVKSADKIASQLTIPEKIDLLCARYPGLDKMGLMRYDWWSECLHGVARAGKATVFPKPIGMGATWDKSLVHRIAIAISDEARAKHHRVVSEKGYSGRHFGLTFFSPTLNIARDPRWGRTTECFGEDPMLVSDMGVAFVKGLQGDDPYYLKAVATAKHFVANNEENRRIDGSATVDEVSLREYYFPAFREAVEKGKVTSIMGAYNALNGVPCCTNSFLLTDVLRDEWGFDGVVISDGSAIDKLYTHHKYVSTKEEAAAKALKAGCDMSLRDEYREGLKKAYEKGLITEKDLNIAAARVLNLRARLGLDKGTVAKNPYCQIPYSVVECDAHQSLALEAAEKSMVLLKNEGLLPLKFSEGKKQKIALIGEAFKTVYYGDYSGNPDNNLTLMDCLKKDIGNKAELTWIGERSAERIIPANCLSRSDDQAYDGKLGLSADYYASEKVQGDAFLSRQDLTIDFVPSEDASLKQVAKLSACWNSTLRVPQSGRYLLSLAASGRVKVYIDKKVVLSKSSNSGFKVSFDVVLEQGKDYQMKIVCEDMNKRKPLRLAWTPPFKEGEDSPSTVAKRSDVVILFVRDDNSSEGRDRKNLNLTDAQMELIKEVTSANPNTILLLGGGSALSLSEIVPRTKSLLYVWVGGQGESKAISNILQGKVNPSGKTPITFYMNERQIPALNDYDVKNGRSYQYFKGDVLYPFGFGLSYTKFAYGTPRVNGKKIPAGKLIIVSAQVTNQGNCDGEEVVQCYLSSPDWAAQGLKQKLVGYQRVYLKKGETKRVEFRVEEGQLKRWNIKKKEWHRSSEKYEISVVPHSGEKNAVSFSYQ